MPSLAHHFASWFLKALCLPLILKAAWLLPIALEGTHHAPVEAGMLLVLAVLLMLSWAAIFWRRGTMLRTSRIPFPVALIWLTLRAFLDALAATVFALGLAACLLLLFGGLSAQESILNVSLGSHFSDSVLWINATANWLIHTTVAALFYTAGLRFDDALDHLRVAPARG
jgi:hypothetical protein